MPRWFVSHSTRDRVFVETELLRLLEVLDQQCWYSREAIKSGDDWEMSIKSGLELCDNFILVMSPHSAQSEWVRKETHWALNHRPGHVLPLMIAPCRAEEFHPDLPRIQHLDFAADPTGARIQFLDIIHRAAHGYDIAGEWDGKLVQHDAVEREPKELPYEGSLLVQGTTVTGVGRLTIPALGRMAGLTYTLHGVIIDRRFLKLEYSCTDPGRLQFGTFLMEIDPAGRKMAGKLVGFGANSQSIITGNLVMEKRD